MLDRQRIGNFRVIDGDNTLLFQRIYEQRYVFFRKLFLKERVNGGRERFYRSGFGCTALLKIGDNDRHLLSG